MIIDAIIGILVTVIKGILSGLALLVPPMPDWFVTAWEGIGTAYGYAMTLDTWIPVSLAMTMAGAVLAAYLVGLTIQIARTIISYLTLGGGAS